MIVFLTTPLFLPLSSVFVCFSRAELQELAKSRDAITARENELKASLAALSEKATQRATNQMKKAVMERVNAVEKLAEKTIKE